MFSALVTDHELLDWVLHPLEYIGILLAYTQCSLLSNSVTGSRS